MIKNVKTYGLMIATILILSTTILPAVYAIECVDCSVFKSQLDDLYSQQEIDEITCSIENSSIVSSTLTSLSSDTDDLDFSNASIVSEENTSNDSKLIIVPVKDTIDQTALCIYMHEDAVIDVGSFIITGIENGMLLNYTLSSGGSVYYAETQGCTLTERGCNGMILSYNTQDEFDEDFWICWLACINKIVNNGPCWIACYECFINQGGPACFLCATCIIGGPLLCALYCSGESGQGQAQASSLITLNNEVYTTEASVYECYVYNATTSQLVVSNLE